MNKKQKPYRLYLTEDQMPKQYYNLRADMKELPEPMLNPITKKEATLEDLLPVFCKELAKQELDNETRYIDIPKEVQEMYRIYRPSPLVRAYNLEKYLETPAKIYYKFEGNNTSGSHKLNSAIAQVYYAKQEGIKHLTTETGAGQWGTALSEACSYFDIPLSVYMVKSSYEQKPFRKDIMKTFGANVISSPSNTTDVGRKILKEHPNTTGSLGCAISEAVEKAITTPNFKYVLGSVLNQVLLHQSIIGLECETAFRVLNEYPDIIIGCAGGGSNLGGLIAPFMRDKIKGIHDSRIIAVEPASCPSFLIWKMIWKTWKDACFLPILPKCRGTRGNHLHPMRSSHTGRQTPRLRTRGRNGNLPTPATCCTSNPFANCHNRPCFPSPKCSRTCANPTGWPGTTNWGGTCAQRPNTRGGSGL